MAEKRTVTFKVAVYLERDPDAPNEVNMNIERISVSATSPEEALDALADKLDRRRDVTDWEVESMRDNKGRTYRGRDEQEALEWKTTTQEDMINALVSQLERE